MAVQDVRLVNSKLDDWGTAENRARLLTQSFAKLNPALAAKAYELLQEARKGYDREVQQYA